jgi:hypothetical protein
VCNTRPIRDGEPTTPQAVGTIEIQVGDLVRDTRRERVGVVMDRSHGQVWLRPPAGGREWTAKIGEVQPADELSVKVSLVNKRSRDQLR